MLLAAAVLAAGCGAAAQQPPHRAAAPVRQLESARTAAPPPGFRTHLVTAAGVSIALPIGWQVLAQRDASGFGVLQILTKLDRSFTMPVAELSSPDSPLKLFAFDRSFLAGRPTTIQVVQATYRRPGGYNSWAPRMAAALRHAPGLDGAVAVAGVQLPAGLALRGTYRTRSHDTVVAYLVPGPTGLWALLLRTPTPRARRDSGLLARAAASFRAFRPVGGPYGPAPAPPGA
ncbi:MAG TPA: hypothetical protein VFL60_02860 [Gaiellaceae bacterium]|nr:hypothetical protein [Gaiellaceae bacterium]